MKKRISILLMAVISLILFNQNSNAQNCVFCNSNTVGDSSSAIGAENISTGKYSLASGFQNEATGDYSIAFGKNALSTSKNSIALGENVEANDWYSVAIGRDCKANSGAAFALGMHNIAQAESSYLLGSFLKSYGGGSVTIGFGSSDYLLNGVAYSLMVGFNSNVPTLFVGPSSGTGTTGKVGIGNVVFPEAKLHILGDNGMFSDNDASLFIESSGEYYSTIWLGDTMHSIQTKPGSSLLFNNSSDKGYVFKNGNIFIDDQFSGLILRSPDGHCWKATANNSGSFVMEGVNCSMITGEDKIPATSQQIAHVFPNPAGDKLSIEVPDEIQQAYVGFYNEQGILLLQKEISGGKQTISLKKMPQGILIVKVSDAKGTLLTTEKVMHQ